MLSVDDGVENYGIQLCLIVGLDRLAPTLAWTRLHVCSALVSHHCFQINDDSLGRGSEIGHLPTKIENELKMSIVREQSLKS